MIISLFEAVRLSVSISPRNLYNSLKKIKENIIYHLSPMQTEKSQAEGKRIMPETRFTEFPALSVDPSVGIFPSASKTDVWLFFLPITLKNISYRSSFFFPFLKFDVA